MLFTLVNYCDYSFRDLLKASGIPEYRIILEELKLKKLCQSELNKKIRELCNKAKWYYKDIEKNGVIYTSFSPKIKIISKLEKRSSSKLLEELEQTIFLKKNSSAN